MFLQSSLYCQQVYHYHIYFCKEVVCRGLVFINSIQGLPQCDSPKLQEAITCAKFAHMGVDGDQSYDTIYYNLDVIISVGYRINSRQGTHFRQWANGDILAKI